MKKRIAERKSAYTAKKTSAVITIKAQKPTEESHEQKKLQDSVKEHIQNDDLSKPEQSTTKDEISKTKSQKQETFKAKPSQEYKILGVSDFEKTVKVIIPYYIYKTICP